HTHIHTQTHTHRHTHTRLYTTHTHTRIYTTHTRLYTTHTRLYTTFIQVKIYIYVVIRVMNMSYNIYLCSFIMLYHIYVVLSYPLCRIGNAPFQGMSTLSHTRARVLWSW